MLPSEIVNSFSEDELDFLLYLINNQAPRIYEYGIAELKSYHKWALEAQVKAAQNGLTNEGKVVYSSLCEKLKILLPEGFKIEPLLPEPVSEKGGEA